MTPTNAMIHLRQLVKELGNPWGVRVQSTGVFLTRGICPWDIGLKLEVDNPAQREAITQKIQAFVKIHPTDLNLRKDDAGYAYFYESQGYRFHDERGVPTTRDQYPEHAAYKYILLPVESWDFALAEKAPLHPARPGPSFSIVTWAGPDTNLPLSALAKTSTFNCQEYRLVKKEAQPAPPEPPPPKIQTSALQPMTPEAALDCLRQWVKEQKKEHGTAFGVTVFSGGPIFLATGIYPWEIGLRLIVDKPEHFDAIKQKIKDYSNGHFTQLVVKKDGSGHAYFDEEHGYRFFDKDDSPSNRNEYPQHGGYRYVLVKAELPTPHPITDALRPLPQPPIPPGQTPNDQCPPQSIETANPVAFQKAQRCPVTQFFARIWACVAQALVKLARCLCCRSEKATVPDRLLS